MIREAAYEGVPKEMRADLHQGYARWFERYSGEGVIVGYHLEQAFHLRRELGAAGAAQTELAREAGALLAEAGERAYRRDDVPAAINLLGRATVLRPTDDPGYPALLVLLGSSLMKAGRFGEAEATLERACETARDVGDRRSELRAIIERQQLRSFTEPSAITDEISRVAADVIPELETLGDDLGLAKAWRLLSDVHVMSSHFEARAEALERAIAHARRAPEARSEVNLYFGLLAEALYWGPTPALEGAERCREFLAATGENPALHAAVKARLGAMLASQGHFDEARDVYAESVELYERLGLGFGRAVAALYGAEIELLAADPAAAEAELRRAYETLEAMGESGMRAVVAASLAAVLCAQGRDDESWEFVEITEEITEPADLFPQVLERTTQARLLVRENEPERAEQVARDALALAVRTDCFALHADARVALATALAHSGRHEGARELVTEAQAIHEAKGNVVSASRLTGSLGTESQRL